MAIGTSDFTKAFEGALLRGEHNFMTDTFKVALYDNSASIDLNTEAYSDQLVGQIAAGGDYLEGGNDLTVALAEDDIGWHVGVENVEWTRLPNPRTVRGALVYNDSHPTKGSVAVLNFGTSFTIVDGRLTLEFAREALGVPFLRLHADSV